ncbi:MAG: nitroreductase family protein [Eubacterium sp.]|nr:nitroreductase family protein [Eubacterium sp.]
METIKTLSTRCSTRSFKSEQISDAELSAVLDGAYLAPVAMGKYEDTKLLVIQNQDVLNKVNELFAAAVHDESMRPTYGAPTVIYVLGKEDAEDILIGMNAGAVTENMLIAATNAGLGSCYLMGVSQVLYKNEEVKKLLQIPEGYRTLSAVALGYPTEALSERSVDKNKMDTLYIK